MATRLTGGQRPEGILALEPGHGLNGMDALERRFRYLLYMFRHAIQPDLFSFKAELEAEHGGNDDRSSRRR